jgi:menaquinone-dependent protoporphyrinogen oxidase
VTPPTVVGAPLATVLLIYTTTHGHTAKVARRIADRLREENVEVDIRDMKEAGDADPTDYGAVVAGASLHAGHHQRAMVTWVKEHRVALAERPSAFFSVSLTAADDTEEARTETKKCIDDFVEETGWTPGRTEPIAGALQYREYDIFTRTLMRLKMRHDGRPSDTSHDYDYTDWDAVDGFGRELAALVGAPLGSA